MPNIRSATKRMKSDEQKRVHNQAVLSELDRRYKKLSALRQKGEQSNGAALKEQARRLVSKLDKAVVHGVIPHRRADRKKARIAKLLSKN